jgi:SAM-dependent methyltransferase
MNPTSSEMWDQRFGAEGYAYGAEPNDFLVEQAGLIPDGPVLCLAEGEGRNGVWLAERGHAVTAVDFSSAGQRKAAALAAARGVSLDYQLADLSLYEPAVGAYAGVVSIFCHLPAAIRRVMYARAARALAPGGVIVIESYTPAQLAYGTGGPKDVALLVSLADLRAELDGLELVVAREVERDIHEGALHGGRSAVVQVVARRPG